MSLTLHFHPLSSYCQKALVALYENETPFTKNLVDLSQPAHREALLRLWGIGKFPVLRDDARDVTVPEATIIIEYLAQHHPGRTALVPADPDLARETRLRDRFFDLHVNEPMAAIVADRRRPEGAHDPHGVAHATARLRTAYDVLEAHMATRTWAIGEAFTMADCAAAPSLYYANEVLPFGESRPHVTAYFERLRARPSYARAFRESEPYLAFFPR